MYILDERTYAEEIINANVKPSNVSVMNLVNLLAIYYVNKFDVQSEFIQFIFQRTKDFSVDYYEEYIYASKIKEVCKAIFKNPELHEFKKIPYVPVSREEISVVNNLKTMKEKKVMFTLFAMSRYENCNGWINKKDSSGWSEIFKIANVSGTMEANILVLHHLYKQGLINPAKMIDNLNLQVVMHDCGNDDLSIPDVDDADIAYRIIDFKNLGYQYVVNFVDGYRACEHCGRPFKISAKANMRKYCKYCAKEVDREKARLRKKSR